METVLAKFQKIVLLSDTHGKHRLLDVPEDADVIIHCGDACNDGNLTELSDFFEWYSGLKIPYKIFVNGNHDLPFELEPDFAVNMVPNNIIWLNDESITIRGIKIKAVSPFFYFQEQDLSENVDIILSHAPPFGILDNGIGSKELADYALAIRPKYHVFGHNHAGFGKIEVQGIWFINASGW